MSGSLDPTTPRLFTRLHSNSAGGTQAHAPAAAAAAAAAAAGCYSLGRRGHLTEAQGETFCIKRVFELGFNLLFNHTFYAITHKLRA